MTAVSPVSAGVRENKPRINANLFRSPNRVFLRRSAQGANRTLLSASLLENAGERVLDMLLFVMSWFLGQFAVSFGRFPSSFLRGGNARQRSGTIRAR